MCSFQPLGTIALSVLDNIARPGVGAPDRAFETYVERKAAPAVKPEPVARATGREQGGRAEWERSATIPNGLWMAGGWSAPAQPKAARTTGALEGRAERELPDRGARGKVGLYSACPSAVALPLTEHRDAQPQNWKENAASRWLPIGTAGRDRCADKTGLLTASRSPEAQPSMRRCNGDAAEFELRPLALRRGTKGRGSGGVPHATAPPMRL
jgi:hypothetical protein